MRYLILFFSLAFIFPIIELFWARVVQESSITISSKTWCGLNHYASGFT
ncbi:MAG: hypothetical protein PHC97_00955 [Patescibacteria group bacterium]|nr:hypothetical protein [Patescibacteria group bacterium]